MVIVRRRIKSHTCISKQTMVEFAAPCTPKRFSSFRPSVPLIVALQRTWKMELPAICLRTIVPRHEPMQPLRKARRYPPGGQVRLQRLSRCTRSKAVVKTLSFSCSWHMRMGLLAKGFRPFWERESFIRYSIEVTPVITPLFCLF